VTKSPTRFLLAVCVLTLVTASGCSSCEQSADIPMPKEGRLPHPAGGVPAAAVTSDLPPPKCAVVASASPEEGTAPLEVQFNAEGTCSEAIGNFSWNFGDGSAPSQEQNPAHTYTAAGTYTASVTLDDPQNGVKDSDELTLTVTASEP
jgi:PKD repeat protein